MRRRTHRGGLAGRKHVRFVPRPRGAGIGTTCTEYMTRGIGMKCWVHYDFAKPTALFELNLVQIYPLIDLLRVIASDGVVPAGRLSCAS